MNTSNTLFKSLSTEVVCYTSQDRNPRSRCIDCFRFSMKLFVLSIITFEAMKLLQFSNFMGVSSRNWILFIYSLRIIGRKFSVFLEIINNFSSSCIKYLCWNFLDITKLNVLSIKCLAINSFLKLNTSFHIHCIYIAIKKYQKCILSQRTNNMVVTVVLSLNLVFNGFFYVYTNKSYFSLTIMAILL